MQIGYIGMGSMGSALAQRLVAHCPVMVHDRNPAACDRLTQLGACTVASMADFSTCDLVFLCLPTSDVVEDLLFAPQGLAEQLRPGSVVIDQTSGDPRKSRAIAALLAVRRIGYADAPVSGGTPAAYAGNIAIMVGASYACLERITPYLKLISDRVFHAGDIGCGHVAKLANNIVSASLRLVTMEAVALGQKNGVPAAILCEIMAAGSGRNVYLENILRGEILNGNLRQGAPLQMMHKDVSMACNLGKEAGVNMPHADLTKGIFEEAIQHFGALEDVGALALLNDHLSKTHIVPPGHALREAAKRLEDLA